MAVNHDETTSSGKLVLEADVDIQELDVSPTHTAKIMFLKYMGKDQAVRLLRNMVDEIDSMCECHWEELYDNKLTETYEFDE